jgi:MFS family permease
VSTQAVAARTIRTDIPARLDRLPWSRFHWRVVIGLGTVWILDGLEVTIVGAIAVRLTEAGSGIHMNAADIGTAAALYVAGACSGALLFGQLTDRYGRRKLFMVTLSLYLIATVATAFAFSPWYFFLCRFFTGMGLGGEYSAINSAIDELIPARNRGRVDLAINGSYWVGSALGSLAAVFLLSPKVFPKDVGWRLAFGIGAVLGFGILIVRRQVPESPRWLFIHGHEEEAERIVEQIETGVQRETEIELPDPGEAITVRQRDAIPFRELARVAIKRYPRRAFLGLALFVGQAFLYNAVTFDLGTILHDFFRVSAQSVPIFLTVFAVSNFLGPLLLGRYFDTIGRIPMISGTYLVSAGVVAALAVLLLGSSLTSWSFMALVLAAFFFASAGASAAYLTVSEIFPMETRALAIALFYAVGTATGGIVGPELFGQLINSGQRHLVAIGFFVGAGAMAIGGLAEIFFGIRAEQQSLEHIAKPLSEEEAEGLLPLPVEPEKPPRPEVFHEQHEAARSREQAEGERALAAERRAALHELRSRLHAEGDASEDRLRPEEIAAEVAELRAQSLDELAASHEERARALQARSEVEQQVALERAAAAQERARMYEERAAALSADPGEAEIHATLAEAAAARSREHEQRAMAREASAEAERLGGAAAELARARAEMHESWAAVHAARAAALEAKARGGEEQAVGKEREAHDRELIANAAQQRVDAAEHRARAEVLRVEDAALSQAEREERIRKHSSDDEIRTRRAPSRLRPGPGDSMYSPGMVGTAGGASARAAQARRELEREIDAIGRALDERGPLERDELKRLVGGRYWGPGRFREALRAAVRAGRVARQSRTIYGPVVEDATRPEAQLADEEPAPRRSSPPAPRR